MNSPRLLFLAMICGLGSMAPLQGQAPDTPAKPPAAAENGFNFSQIIGSLSFINRKDFEQPGLGYGLRYENDRLLKADIYVYDNGLRDLKDGIKSDEIKEELHNTGQVILAMQEQKMYENVKQMELAEKVAVPSGVKFLWSRHSFRQIGGGEGTYLGDRISDTFLTIHKGKFVKIRITTKKDDLAEHGKEIERFVNQIGSCLQ